MATFEELMTAAGNADAAGDTAAAKQLVELAAQARASGEQSGLSRFMGQVNAGIAETAGGLIDLLNPFDKPLWEGGPSTGSATVGLTKGMTAIGSPPAQNQPQGLVEGAGRGLGAAVASAVPIAKGLQAMRGVGGVAGAVISDAATAMSTPAGLAIDAAAGAVSRGAQEGAASQGAPVWAQQALAVLAPLVGLPAAVAVGKTGGVTGFLVRKGVPALGRAVAPYTKTGGRAIARDRLQSLAGGADRARELAARISPTNEFGLTPAQQTADPNMMAIEQTAMRVSPDLRARLEAQRAGSQQAATEAVAGMGGDPSATRAFISDRQSGFVDRLTKAADAAVAKASAEMQSVSPQRGEIDNSLIVRRNLDTALAQAEVEERGLWEAIPKDVMVGTGEARAAAEAAVATVGRARSGDVPKVVKDLLLSQTGFGESESVLEMHALYSELRRVARSAMAGSDQNKNTARIANEIADAIMRDLGAAGGTTAVGRQINDARAFSSAMHETFDRGAVGKLLNRTLDGDTTIEPELSLGRTVGSGGAAGSVAQRQIGEAAGSPSTGGAIADYLRGRFETAAFNAEGKFSARAAQTFLRANSDILAAHPQLLDEMTRAAASQKAADAFVGRVAGIRENLADPRKSVGTAFLAGSPEAAAQRIIDSDNPANTAAEIVRQAIKEPTGAALAGLKGAFTRNLIGRATKPDGDTTRISGQEFVSALTKAIPAMGRVFSAGELARLKAIGNVFVKIDAARGSTPDIGGLSVAKPNKLIELLARIQAAKYGASVAGRGSGAIQIPGMFSERMRVMLSELTNNRATRILLDAVEDASLFKLLLLDPKPIAVQRRIVNRLAPYFAGAGAAMTEQETETRQ